MNIKDKLYIEKSMDLYLKTKRLLGSQINADVKYINTNTDGAFLKRGIYVSTTSKDKLLGG